MSKIGLLGGDKCMKKLIFLFFFSRLCCFLSRCQIVNVLSKRTKLLNLILKHYQQLLTSIFESRKVISPVSGSDIALISTQLQTLSFFHYLNLLENKIVNQKFYEDWAILLKRSRKSFFLNQRL